MLEALWAPNQLIPSVRNSPKLSACGQSGPCWDVTFGSYIDKRKGFQTAAVRLLRDFLPTFQRACHPCCCCVSSAWHTAHHHMARPCRCKTTSTVYDWQTARLLTPCFFSYSALFTFNTLDSELHNNVDSFTWMSSVKCSSALVIFASRVS